MKNSKIVNASVMINLIALALSTWSLVYTIADLFNANENVRILVSTVISIGSFCVGRYFIKQNCDCTKAWDDEED